MNTEKTSEKKADPKKTAAPQKAHGFFHCVTLNCEASEALDFLSQESFIREALSGLSKTIDHELSLQKVAKKNGGDDQQIIWKSKDSSKLKFETQFTLRPAGERGTFLFAETTFEVPGFPLLSKFLSKEDTTPSTLMMIFLRRLKAKVETGVIATTEGQPSGREELPQNEFLH